MIRNPNKEFATIHVTMRHNNHIYLFNYPIHIHIGPKTTLFGDICQTKAIFFKY